MILENDMKVGENFFLDKNVLVTGSGRGIGRAIALEFARLGANVVVNFFRNRAPAQQTVDEINEMGRKAWLVKANIGEIHEIKYLFSEIEQHAGGIDFLICNAASGYNRPALQQKPKGWDWTMNINARSLLFAAQRAVPLMENRGGGHIVSISSPGSTSARMPTSDASAPRSDWSVSSNLTTASAPLGTGAPVIILTAVPGSTLVREIEPATTVSITRRTRGDFWLAPRVSAALTA